MIADIHKVTGYHGLGDAIMAVNYLHRVSLKTGEPTLCSRWVGRHHDVDHGPTIQAVIDVTRGPGKVIMVDEKSTCRNTLRNKQKIVQGRYYPTKYKWVGSTSHRVGYQFNGRCPHIKNPSHPDRDLILHNIRQLGYEPVQLGKPMTLDECARQLSACKLFVGCSSGMAHLARAAGLPIVYSFWGATHSEQWRGTHDLWHLNWNGDNAYWCEGTPSVIDTIQSLLA